MAMLFIWPHLGILQVRDDRGGEMKERPIIFNGEMVRAVLDGRKTQTRRVIKPQPKEGQMLLEDGSIQEVGPMGWETVGHVSCPYGAPGDRLWVREAWQASVRYKDTEHVHCNEYVCDEGRRIPDTSAEVTAAHEVEPEEVDLYYASDPYDVTERDASASIGHAWWRPSIHMPRWASRINLLVKDVRVERVQDITEEDCLAEKRGFGWDLNPFVWVVEFEKLELRWRNE